MEMAICLLNCLKDHIKAFMNIPVTAIEQQVAASGLVIFLTPARPSGRGRCVIDPNDVSISSERFDGVGVPQRDDAVRPFIRRVFLMVHLSARRDDMSCAGG
jgi:hypothetical protein